MSENFTWREQLKTNFKINLLFSILWANPQGVTRAQMSQISGDVINYNINLYQYIYKFKFNEKRSFPIGNLWIIKLFYCGIFISISVQSVWTVSRWVDEAYCR